MRHVECRTSEISRSRKQWSDRNSKWILCDRKLQSDKSKGLLNRLRGP